ncbi:MAG: hypothetical protein QOI82_1106 [Actinomycetota bacterium]|jgi:hypothetical protein|nr:hypothetical protein [Actinomycetota bacterium]
MPIMPSSEATDLTRAFERYRQAQAVLRGHRKPTLEEVETALAARVELFRCLVDSGWQAPEGVTRQINLDAVLVDQPHGALGG